MQRSWPYGTNPILKATENSCERLVTISTYTDSSIAEPFPDLYSYLHPEHVAFITAYSDWTAQNATQKGDTATLSALLKQLPAAVYGWHAAIEAVYPKGTPAYLKLFPNGRSPFSRGKQEIRMNRVSALSTNLTGIASLATVKTEVDAFYTNLIATNAMQKAQKNETHTKSARLEELRVNLCQALFYVYAGLAQEFNDEPERIEQYFLIDLIRRKAQKVFKGHLSGGALKVVVKRTLKPATIITLKNTGAVDVQYYMAATKAGALPIGTTPVSVPAGLAKDVPVSDLGSAENKFLTVKNTAELIAADWEVNI